MGNGTIIMPGTIIGKGCIIAAGTVVRGNIPVFSIYGKSPVVIMGDSRKYLAKNVEGFKFE